MTVTTTNMLCDDDRLRNEILWLISLGHEGGYWDFKSDYPECNEDKLMDIICMANNLENRNAYLIYGVNDDGSVCGIENTSHPRLKTINFVQFLRERPFAGGYVPVVELKTFMIEDHEVDVLIVSNSNYTPYFLYENYEKSNDKRKWLRAGAIYTRKQDENTPRNKTASFGDTELLWRKRFGAFMQPFDKFRILLRDASNWSDANWDVGRRCYHKWNPEFQIIASDSRECWETLRYFYDDERMMYAPLCLNYLSTTLYETSLWFMDMGRCVIPEPRRKTAFGDFSYYYFLVDTIDGDIFNLITNGCCFCHNRSGLEMPVLIFANKSEQDDYEKYISDKVMAKTKVISVANQKGGVGKNTSVYCIGAGLALQGKKVLLLDVDPQGNLSKMLGQRKPHELPHTLGDVMNDVVSGKEITEHTEILHHHEGFDYVPGNRVLSAVEVGLVNVMSRETVLRQYLDSVKKEYDYQNGGAWG